MAGDAKDRTGALERTLLLAAFFRDRRGRWVTLADVGEELEEYSGPPTEGLRKKFWRDTRDLREDASIDIEWSVDKQAYKLQPPYFSTAERAALLDAARSVFVDGPQDGAGRHELGQSIGADAANVAIRVPAIVKELQPAVAERRVVEFMYKGTLRRAEPYRIGSWRTSWYLLAREIDSDRRKRFRLDRIETRDDETITVVGEPDAFTVPEGLDWSVEFCLDPNDWGPDPAVVARIETDADHHGMIEHAFDGAVTTFEPDGRVIVEVTVRHYVSFVVRVLGFGTHARVLEPPVLVERTKAWLAPQTGAE